ncbi:hypothetical protein BH18ACT4_BH18ACT4_14150 [soil metagenome]
MGWVRKAIRSGDRWVAEFDIVGFFDNLRHARLLREVAKVVDDVEVIGLVRRWLQAGVLTEAGLQARLAGTPQGCVMTPHTQQRTSRSAFPRPIAVARGPGEGPPPRVTLTVVSKRHDRGTPGPC